MGEAAFDDDLPFVGQSLRAAAVICRTEQGNLHAGLLYRASNGTAAVLHLGWQDRLYTDWAWPRLWAAPDVEPERLRSVAGMCRLIWKRYQETRRFPYAIAFKGTSFDASGKLVLSAGAQGLTCATFILAVLNSVGLNLIDEESWPIRSEEDRRFVESLSFATPTHLELLKKETEAGCRRIRPEEVVGACASDPPAKFDASREAGDRIVSRLDER